MGAAVVDGAVGTATTLDADVVDNPVAGCDLDHVVALGEAFAVVAPATGFASSPGAAAACMANGKHVDGSIPPLLARLKDLHPSKSSLHVFQVKITFHCVQTNLIGETGS